MWFRVQIPDIASCQRSMFNVTQQQPSPQFWDFRISSCTFLLHARLNLVLFPSVSNCVEEQGSLPWFYRRSLHIWTLVVGFCWFFWCYLLLMWSETGRLATFLLVPGLCRSWETSSLELTSEQLRRWGDSTESRQSGNNIKKIKTMQIRSATTGCCANTSSLCSCLRSMVQCSVWGGETVGRCTSMDTRWSKNLWWASWIPLRIDPSSRYSKLSSRELVGLREYEPVTSCAHFYAMKFVW